MRPRPLPVVSLAILLLFGLFRNESEGASTTKDTDLQTPAREAALETAASLHASGLKQSKSGNSKAALQCFAEAYRVRRELLGLFNTNTYSSLEGLAFGQSPNRREQALVYLADLETATTNLFHGQDLTNRLMAVYERQHSLYGALGKKAEAEALQERMLRLSGLSEVDIARLAEARKVAAARAEVTRAEMEKWASQMRSGVLPQLSQLTKSNPASTIPDTDKAKSGENPKRGYSEKEVGLLRDQNNAMETLLGGVLTNLQARTRDKTTAPRSESGMQNVFRGSLGDAALQNSNLLQKMVSRTNAHASSRSIESWFHREWDSWNRAFERGTPLNRLVGQKQYSDPLLKISGGGDETGRVMGLLALNLKGLLLDREFRLQAALARSSDPGVASWREKLWDLQIQSLSARPQPIDPAEEGFAPKEVVRNSPFSIVENKKLEAAQRELRVLAMSLAGAEQKEIASPEKVSETLPVDSALVEFMRYGRDFGGLNLIEERFGAVILVKGKEPAWIDLGPATKISSLVTHYVDLMRKSDGDPPAPGQVKSLLETICDVVWKPLEGALPPNCKTAFIAPDSDLHLLSFATLRRNDRFLCERHNFIYVVGGRRLPQPADFGADKRSVEVWADPDFDVVGATADRKWSFASVVVPIYRDFGFKFGRLVGTEKEAMSVKDLAEARGLPVHLHLKQSASEAELRKLDRPLILHLGTHGFFLPMQKAGSDRAWEAGGLGNQFNGDAALYQSGIALAGANKAINAWGQRELPAPFNDGIFVAAEAAQLNLQGTWLVTLSACDTGLGGVANGESLLGIKLGFLQAGAQNVCFSLWRVSDSYAPGFIRSFYAGALKSGNAPEALAGVQRDELKRLASVPTRDALWMAVKLAGPFVVTVR